MIDFHQDEWSFWRELNPARFHLLARAYRDGGACGQQRADQTQPAPAGRENLRADGKWANLAEYLGGE